MLNYTSSVYIRYENEGTQNYIITIGFNEAINCEQKQRETHFNTQYTYYISSSKYLFKSLLLLALLCNSKNYTFWVVDQAADEIGPWQGRNKNSGKKGQPHVSL